MELQLKNRLKGKKSMKILFFSIIFLLFIFVILFIYHTILSYSSNSNYPPVGKFVDVGNYQLHMYAIGKKTDLPTILLESGSGTPSSVSDWKEIQPDLAKITRVISYDRAGYGWSDQAHNDRTSEQIVKDLHKMLEISGERGPYILVGHSFGGFNMQLFAHRYPDEVAGIVLLDTSLIGKSPKVSDSALLFHGSLRKLGVMRIIGELGILPVPEAVMSDARSKAFLYRQFYNEDQRSEIKFMTTTDENQLKIVQKEGLGNIPMIILSSRAEEKEHKDWQKSQDTLLQLSTNSKRKIVENSSHYIQHDQPKIVIESILDILR
ncbi:alpha/beta fold hydrolase [Bacillus sp. CGMCC 1.16607]|uniref:alpha/beta fold hydrolase n=1 Tax=Bacillus sp. CGMCC 1.16607 TaxID=3351842 RepID=UPI0036370522